MIRRWGIFALAATLAIGIALVSTIAWLVTTPGGARLVLDRVAVMLGKGAKVTGVEGSLYGTLRIQSIEVARPDLVILVRDVVIERSPDAPWFGHVVFRRVEAGYVEVRSADSGAAARVPLAFPAPYPLRVEAGRVGELRIGKLVKSGEPPPPVVLKEIEIAGEGDEKSWTLDKGGVTTAWGRLNAAGSLETKRPFALALQGDFSGEREDLRYRASAKFRGTLTKIDATFDAEERDLRATGTALLEPFEKQPLRALNLRARDVDVGRYAGTLHTRLSVDAALQPTGKGFAGTVRIDNADAGPIDKSRLPITSIQGRAAWTHDANAQDVEVSNANVTLAGGGTAQGSGRWRPGRIEMQAKVAAVDAAQWHSRLRPTQLEGTVSAVGESAGQRFELALVDPRFSIDGAATLANSRLEVQAVRLKHAGGVVEGKGFVALAQRREFRFEGAARHFDPAAFVKDTPGDLNFDLVASGTAEPIAGDVRLDFAPSQLAGLALAGNARVAGDMHRISNADVQLTLGDARVQAKGAFGRAGDSMEVAVQAPSFATLAKPFGIAASGKLDARATFTGTFAAPGARFDVNGANLALPGGFYAASLATRGEISSEANGKVDATLEARTLTHRSGDAVHALADRANVTLQGTRAAHRASLVAAVAKDAELRLAVEGGLDARAPKLTWQGTIASLSLTGPSAFDLAGPASLVAAADRVELTGATFTDLWGEARLDTTRWTPALLEARGSTPRLVLRNAARALRIPGELRGNLVIAGDWDLRAAETVDGVVSISRSEGDMRVGDPPTPLGLEELKLRAESRNGHAKAVATVRGRRVGQLDGEINATLVRRGAGLAVAENAPLDGSVDAKMESIAWIAAYMGPEAKADGRVNARLAIAGTFASPRFSGRVDGENVSLREPQNGFEVEKGVVSLVLNDRSLVVEKLAASTPWHPSEQAILALEGYARPAEGTLTASGSIDLGSRTGAIDVKAVSVPVTQIATRFLALTGDAKIEARSDGILASGNLRADAGWIGALATPLPSVSDDVVVVRSSVSADERRNRERMRLDVRFSLGDHVSYRGRGLETKLAGDLRITGEPGSGLRGTGSIRTVAGTYDAYGRKLSIEHGSLTFFGSLENPALDVLALRKGLPVEAGVEVLGNVSRPRVRLISQPEVPDPEKISWLVLGRAPGDVSQGEAAMLASAATSLLGRGDGSSLTKKFGFDDVKVGRADTVSALGVLPQSTVAGKTGTAAVGDVVSIGKRLTKDVYIVYEHGLADAEGALRLTWQITQAFQILLRAGYLPGADAVYRWTFQ